MINKDRIKIFLIIYLLLNKPIIKWSPLVIIKKHKKSEP